MQMNSQKRLNKKRVLIIEPGLDGHRATYLNEIVVDFCKKSWTVVLGTTPEVLGAPELAVKFPALKSVSSAISEPIDNTKIAGLPGSHQIKYWLHAKKIYKKCIAEEGAGAPDLVFVPFLDNFLSAIAVLGSPFGGTKISGICMRQKFHYSKIGVGESSNKFRDFIEEALFKALLTRRGVANVYTIDPTLTTELQPYTVAGKLHHFPDPIATPVVVDKSIASSRFGIDTSKKVNIVVYGALNDRKGVLELINAIASSDIRGQYRIVLAGKQGGDIVNALQESNAARLLRSSDRLTEINRYLSVEEESCALSLADIVWVGYRGHLTMSGVLIKAASYGKPVVGCGYGLIGWYIKKYKLGSSFHEHSDVEIINAIEFVREKIARGDRWGNDLPDHNWNASLHVLSADVLSDGIRRA